MNSPTWVNGKRGKALNFVATNDNYVTVADNASLDISSSFTISAWAKPADIPAGGTIRSVVGKESGGNGNYGMVFNGDEVVCVFHDGIAYREHTTTDVNLTAGTWYHVSCVFDTVGNSMAAYVNGVSRTLDSASETNNLVPNASSLSIGSSEPATNEEYFNGTIDEVRIYNRALSASEVAALYAGGTAGAARANASSVTLQNGTTLGPANGLVGHWTFDGADVANVVHDRSHHSIARSQPPHPTPVTCTRCNVCHLDHLRC